MRSTAGATSGSHRVLLDRPNVRPSGACGPCGAGGRESPAHAASASGSGNHASSCDAGCSAGMSSSRSFLPRVRVGGAMAERVGFEPTDRLHGHRGSRETARSRRVMAERVGFEPTDRLHGHRGSRETARSRRVMAERVGFEPTDRLHGQRFSRPPHSTTLAPLLVRRLPGVFRLLLPRNGGEGGIRTHGRVAPTHAFQACTFDHSVTSPYKFDRPLDRRRRKNERNNSELSSARTPEHTVIW